MVKFRVITRKKLKLKTVVRVCLKFSGSIRFRSGLMLIVMGKVSC